MTITEAKKDFEARLNSLLTSVEQYKRGLSKEEKQMQDIEMLALSSEMAGKYKHRYEVIPLEEYREKQSDPLSFHPNGRCGCILLHDEYAFGLRCDHMIWSEGNCEGVEYFWNKRDHEVADELKYPDRGYNMIMLYANHKGYFMEYLLVFHEKEKSED